MSKLHLNRDRQNLGQFTPEQVSEGLAEGRFRPGDLAWREGMETWQPLSTFTDLPAPQIEASVEPPPIEPPAVTGEPIAWDRRREIGIFAALAATIFQALGRPAETFKQLPPAPAMNAPYAFFLLLAMAAFAIYSVEVLTLVNYSAAAIASNPELSRNPETAKAMAMMKDYGVIWFGFLLLFVVPCVPLVCAGVFQFLLMLVGGANESFLKTFAVTCYVFGAASPLLILPCCGPIAMTIWIMIALSLGLSVAHRTDAWRGSLAVVVPFVFCCGGYLVLNLIATMGGMTGAAL